MSYYVITNSINVPEQLLLPLGMLVRNTITQTALQSKVKGRPNPTGNSKVSLTLSDQIASAQPDPCMQIFTRKGFSKLGQGTAHYVIMDEM
jgi:hypothetical protein